MTLDQIKALIRTVPDFPAPGIQFRDITTLIADGRGLASAIDHLAERVPQGTSAIAGIEARGFIFGTALATKLGLGFVPVRKAGKLPVETIGLDYTLEYADARIEIDPSLVSEGERIVLVDDLIATGGTATAAAQLLRQAGAHCDTALFVIDLPELGGADRLRAEGVESHSLIEFAGH
ncbi:adenine phosphoribosyltransferase [Alteraurantiacibacter aquimixticola]|uniref:Adenine phosphoribosyltransferase n=1 Tax=Alteraurantiacibacter aquimixticola TaxID=2489173 RepID=A0A4T3EXN3_9SPHN|nr:adenine phosphoribosyltransferase [Alteraurantiacibacter aquimixticola]TIX49228.1 adenine phosphoribosyltransferase [Alteraurantiacibacter aquimixticola]